jgi:hypothetical protein
MENPEYIKKLEEENALLNKKVMDYEDIIKKFDPSFFEIKGVVDENIEEEKEDLQTKNNKNFDDKIQEYFKKLVESKAEKWAKTTEEKLDDEISKAIKNDRSRGFF